jgi:SAM-dependent methyltransferase
MIQKQSIRIIPHLPPPDDVVFSLLHDEPAAMLPASQHNTGYVTDVAYLPGYYPNMAPSALSFAASRYGARPKPEGDSFHYLELGCGFGETLLTLAASNPDAQFTGVDFLQEHTDHIRDVATSTGLKNVDVLCCDFANLPSRLPQYDFISLHGVWSWVSEDLRQTLLDVIEGHLTTTGVAQVSYNCMPGWSSLLPVRSLIRHFAKTANGDSVERGLAALEKVIAMRKADTALFHDQPLTAELVDKLQNYDPRYIAHEYLNEHWSAFDVADVMQQFASRGLSYVARLPHSNNHWQLMADTAFASHFAERDLDAVETRIDFHANTMFRWDIYAKQARRHISPQQRARQTPEIYFRAAANAGLPHVVKIGNREVGLAGEPHETLLEVMGTDSWTLASLLEHPSLAAVTPESLVEAVDFAVALSLFRVEGGAVLAENKPAHSEQLSHVGAGHLRVPCPYNQRILAGVVPAGKTVALASTVLRQAHSIGDLHALMLNELCREGRQNLEVRVAARLTELGKHLTHAKTGRKATGPEEAVEALEEISHVFLSEVLPELLRTGVVTWAT